jgi:hypothetical protein
MITLKMRPDNVLEVIKNKKFVASFIFDKPDRRLGFHTPEMRFIDKQDNCKRVVFVGATPEAIKKDIKSILEKYNL